MKQIDFLKTVLLVAILAGSMGTNSLPDVNFSEATDDNTGYYAD